MAYMIEIIGVVFILFMAYLTFLEYKKKSINKSEFILWESLWIVSLLLVNFHDYINLFLGAFNVLRVLDLYMILSFMFLFALVFYLFVRNRRTEKRIEELTREIALSSLVKK